MNLLELQQSPERFQQDICIATGSGPRRFGDVMADFQRERFAAVNPCVLAVARHVAPPIPRIWDERTKGASKDTDWTVNLLWLLAFSRRPLRMQVGAFDAEQADEVRLIVKDILRTDGPINSFLRSVIEAKADEIVNPRTGSVIEILTSDQYGSHGSRIDLLLMNELTHQQSSGFAETLFDNLDKMPHAFGVVCTNSGHDPSWQLEWKRTFASLPERWLMLEYNQPSPWVSEAALAEAERRNPIGRFQRLWHGAWSPEEGNPALSPEVIERAFTFAPGENVVQLERPLEHVGGLDLGVSRDASALAILGVQRFHGRHGLIRLVDWKVWRPTKGNKVDLTEVEQAVAEAHAKYDLKAMNFDPWQASHMASRLQAGRVGVYRRQMHQHAGTTKVPMMEVAQTGNNLQKMATCLIESFNDNRVFLRECPELKRDLLRLRVEERSFGFRLVAPHDQLGHGDLGTAFSLALLAASELAAKRIVTAGAPESFASPSTLAELEAGAMDKALAALDRENAIREHRVRQMREMPSYVDDPLYQHLKRIGSQRVGGPGFRPRFGPFR